MDFRWNWWNREQVTKHGILPEEAEHVVRFANRPYPRRTGRDKWYVVGRGTGDRFVEVAFLLDPDETIFVIHAMPLGGRRRRRKRRN
jgi:uncharacterized DUF497 family protein